MTLSAHTRRAALALTLAAATAGTTHAAELRYTVRATEPQAHYVDLDLSYDPLPGTTQTDFKLPVWTPGSYLVREYAKHLEAFRALDDQGKPLAWDKTDKQTWRVRHAAGQPVRVTYRLYANEPSVRTNMVDADHAFLTGAATFLYVAQHLELPVTVRVELPQGWTRVSTALPAVAGQPNTFRAEGYDQLVDTPLEIGAHREFSFMASGVKHRVAMAGLGFNADTAKLKVDMKAVCEQAAKVFGELPVKDQYLFIVHHYGQGSGGLEHLTSCVLDVARTTYDTEDAYRGFLELVAHEYFHLWNVKRLRPAALGPFDYERENYTHMLWVAEGFTAYYDNLLVYRAGRQTDEGYLKMLGSTLSSLENQPGNRVQPVAAASFDAWIRAYRPNENSRNGEISYYPKGAMIGMVFDAQICAFSKGKQNLDDLMRFMYQRYYKEQGRGYTDEEFRQAVSQFTGRDQTDFFARYIYSAATVDWNTALAEVGHQVVDEAPRPAPLTLGATVGGGNRVQYVRRDSPAWKGGLNTGDEVVALDGQPLADPNLDAKVTGRAQPEAAVKLDIRRDGLPRTLTLTPAPSPAVKLTVKPLDKATKDQKRAREKWTAKG